MRFTTQELLSCPRNSHMAHLSLDGDTSSTLVYRIDVQYEINVQVGKFLTLSINIPMKYQPFFTILTGFPEIQPRKTKNYNFLRSKNSELTFFHFFQTKVCNFVSNINEDCSQLSFEVYNIFVAQKLKILENSKHFFHVWTLATLATSRGRNFDLSNLNRVSNFS